MSFNTGAEEGSLRKLSPQGLLDAMVLVRQSAMQDKPDLEDAHRQGPEEFVNDAPTRAPLLRRGGL